MGVLHPYLGPGRMHAQQNIREIKGILAVGPGLP